MIKKKNITMIVGIAILVVLIFLAIFAPYLLSHDPFSQNLYEGLNPPNSEHLFGQDRTGRDVLSRIVYGARVSLIVGFTTVGISLVIGITIGSLSGYIGGIVDEVIMRISDIFLAFPGILLAIAVMAILGPSLNNVIIAMCVFGWVGYARLVRGQILSLKKLDYVTAARAMGCSHLRIICKHLLPNCMAPIIVEATFGMAGAILAEAGLSFLGLGIQPPNPSWGSMLNEGRRFILISSHLTIFPGLAIMISVLGLNLLGDGLRDAFDPKN